MKVQIRAYSGDVLKMEALTEEEFWGGVKTRCSIVGYDVTLVTDDATITIQSVLPNEIEVIE